MAQWLGVFHQEGGCDYTIACGVKTVLFEAEDREAAIEHLYREYVDMGGTDVHIGYIHLCEAIGYDYVSPNDFAIRYRERVRARAAEAEERAARAQYERLKQRFEVKP